MARLAPLALFLLGFVVFAPASAQVDERSFDTLMEDGLRLREDGQDAAALALFERCVAMEPNSGQAIGQVAFAEMALGRLVLAEAHLLAALAFGEDEWVVRHREALEDAQRALNEQIATVEVLGEGEVTFDESGVSVTRRTPVRLRLSPGRHELRVTARGFEPAMTVLDIEAGQRITHVPPRRPRINTINHGPVLSPNPELEANELSAADLDPRLYRVRSIRLDVSAGLFAAGALGTAIGTIIDRPVASFPDGWSQRSGINRVFLVSSISSAVIAVALFIGARVVRGKYRQANATPSF